jgi:hypothetical protein
VLVQRTANGQVGQEGIGFRNTHVLGVSFVMVENVALDPADVSFFPSTSSGRCGTDGVVLEPDRVGDTSTSSVRA